MRRSLRAVALIGSLLGAARGMRAQDAPPPPKALAVYLDCSYYCDNDYIRTQIGYVDWVRDRTASDVDILVSTQNTAANGTRYTFTFIGERDFAQLVDTLQFSSIAGASNDNTRKSMVRLLKEGLVRYLARTPLADQLTISVPGGPGNREQTTPKRDPWHAWVFSASTNGDIFAEQSTRQTYLYGNLSASRTTEDWKFNVSTNENYDESRYTLTDPDTIIVNIQRGFGFSGLAVKSLGAHWSVGLKGSINSSTYLNEKRNMAFTPAVEYDVMPYSQSTRRQLRIQYGIGFDKLAYNDTTIFLKTEQTLPVHTLSIIYAQQEPWGSVNFGANGSSFLNDGSKHSGNVSGGGSLKLIRGLSLNLSASYSVIHDQIYLPKGTATQAEVLLQQRQLLTGYRWSAFFGLSYTFGSLFNNVVNPRFGSGSGGSVIIFN
jgi:hypothetical protein